MTEILIGIVLGIVIAIVVIYLYIRSLIKQVMMEIDELIDVAKNQMMPVIVERENGIIYCYNKDDNQFICQGTNLSEIKAAFKARFPDRTAYLDGGNLELVEELRGELKKDLI